MNLTWAAATDPSTPITYDIYWATTAGGENYATPSQTSTSATGATVTGLTDGTPYYFVVRAKDSAGNEDTNTVEYSVTPTAPADTTPPTFAGASGATDAGTGGAVTLTWAAASDPSTPITYDIYWATTAGGENYATPNQTSSSGTGATVTGLTNGTPYYFVVRAKDSAGNEETNTVEVTATPTAPANTPPVSPSGLSQTEASGTPTIAQGTFTKSATIEVHASVDDANGDPVSLQVEIIDIAGAWTGTPTAACTSTAVAVPGTATATCTGLADGRYKWRVRAYDGTDVSPWVEY